MTDYFCGSVMLQEKVAGGVAVSGLYFNYPARPDVTVLQGLNLLVKPGKTLALVVPVGVAKAQ